MEHYEWVSDMPTAEEPAPVWHAPRWAVIGVVALVAMYLVAGVVYAITASHDRQTLSGIADVFGFLFQVALWPLAMLMH